MTGLTQDDLLFFLKQDQSRTDIIVACMVSVILETERICELLQDQTWVKRMLATVTGTKKADPEIIQNNSIALRQYCAEALTKLFEHDRISDAMVNNLSVQIDEIQFIRHELRHGTETLEKRLDEKTDRLDNYVTLSQEIERRKFGTDGSPFWLYRALAEIDDRTIKDARKTELLQELLREKKIVTAKPVSAKDFITGMLAMPEKYAGAVYLELMNYPGNITAGLAIEAIERWHLQTRSNRQYLDRKTIAAQILEEYFVEPKTEISLETEFEAMVETKMIRISSALERELERKRRQQEIQANMRENAQKLQANVQKGVQGIQTNVKKHMPTVKEFFGNVRDKVKSIPARKKEGEVETYVQPPGTWIKADRAEDAFTPPQAPQEYFTPPVIDQQAPAADPYAFGKPAYGPPAFDPAYGPPAFDPAYGPPAFDPAYDPAPPVQAGSAWPTAPVPETPCFNTSENYVAEERTIEVTPAPVCPSEIAVSEIPVAQLPEEDDSMKKS